jgi:hypothetical protein
MPQVPVPMAVLKKKYFKPSLEVMEFQFENLLETYSVEGEINDPSNYTINARGFDDWDAEE